MESCAVESLTFLFLASLHVGPRFSLAKLLNTDAGHARYRLFC